MKHAITLATAIFAVSAAYAGTFQPWNGEDGISQVNTGLDNGSETSGYWFSYADDGDGGQSKVEWPADTRTATGTSLDSVITHCKGVCGVASLSKGTLKYNPFVGIGFNIYVIGGNIEFFDTSVDNRDINYNQFYWRVYIVVFIGCVYERWCDVGVCYVGWFGCE